jgi:CheY-like chemotaxis protein
MAEENSAKTPAILIVEDEPLVRLFTVETIAAGGFKVLEAGSADEAIRILESSSEIRVVFTDIHIPGQMYGPKLAHAVRNRCRRSR